MKMIGHTPEGIKLVDAPAEYVLKMKIDTYILKAARNIAVSDNDTELISEIDKQIADLEEMQQRE